MGESFSLGFLKLDSEVDEGSKVDTHVLTDEQSIYTSIISVFRLPDSFKNRRRQMQIMTLLDLCMFF